jgi:acetate kinase
MRILALNAGSSSLKTSVIEQPGDRTVARDELERPADAGWTDALRSVLSGSGQVDAVAHRVVHGGARFTAPLLLSDERVADLDALRDLAPLHNRPALEVISATRTALTGVPQVACFDTAFHAALPPAAHVYPLPYAWYEDWGVRRFGFHGLSVAWSIERAAALLGRPPADISLVVAHLGSGCSVSAVAGGRSVDTSMGMTPLEGLMMGTRSGSVDPGILLELLAGERLDPTELGEALQHRSGLLGVSGVSSDLREVERVAVAGESRAVLALEMFVRRAASAIGAAATALPRLDGVVFTGGIGEGAVEVRAAICQRLSLLGVNDLPASPAEEGDAVLSDAGSHVAVLRIHAREDVVMAREVARLLA